MVLKNYMETVVEQQIDSIMKASGCCMCETCRMDVMAVALNTLHPQYVVSTVGEVYSKAKNMTEQHNTDVVSAIAHAADIVRSRPRHKI